MTDVSTKDREKDRYSKHKKNYHRKCNRSNLLSPQGGSGAVVCLAVLLLLCNILWLYSTGDIKSGNYCDHESEYFWGGDPFNKSGKDYQIVQTSGQSQVPFPFSIPNDTVMSLPHPENRNHLRFMTIGISTVWRKENYLLKTINSLLQESTDEEKSDIYIYLLLADADPLIRKKRAEELNITYFNHIKTGLITILQPHPGVYPSINFGSIRRTYSDPVSRVQWRTKQVLDFSFLFWYAGSIRQSQYYLILEDDILSAKHYVSAIKEFVELHKNHHWISLQLAGFLGIGQLVRTEDLQKLVSFLVLFYKEHPVDILFNFWVSLMAPEKPSKDKPTRRVPGLFQHIGIHSTLANKTQNLRDNTFSLIKRKFSHLNPNADVVTTMKHYKSFVAEHAYSPAPGMFWGIPKPGDTFDIVFPQPLQISRLVILTGTSIQDKRRIVKLTKSNKLRDKLTDGHVEISNEFIKMESPNKAVCSTYTFLENFSGGTLDYKGFPEIFPEGVQCIRIVVDSTQKSWLAISEIAIFTLDEYVDIEPSATNNSSEVPFIADKNFTKVP